MSATTTPVFVTSTTMSVTNDPRPVPLAPWANWFDGR